MQNKQIVEEAGRCDGSDEFTWISTVVSNDQIHADSSEDEIVSIGEDLGMRELRLEDQERPVPINADEEIPDLEDFDGSDNVIPHDPVLAKVLLHRLTLVVRVCPDYTGKQHRANPDL